MNTKILLAGVSAIAIAAAASSANAASHKVAEQIDALSKKVEGMSDSFAKKGIKGASLTVSGQVNRAVVYIDEGAKNFISHADSTESSTRVRWVASTPMANGMTASAVLELQQQTVSTAAINNDKGGAGAGFTVRHADVRLSGGFGRISMGQGSVANDGALQSNYMHAGIAGINPESSLGSNDAANAVAFGDGGREDRLMYTTPSFGGASASVSMADEGHVQAMAGYAGTFDNVRVQARLGYADNGDSNDIAGSIGVNVSGFQATVAGSRRDADAAGGDLGFYSIALGYTGRLTSMGNTGLGVLFHQRGGIRKSYSVGVTQDLAPGTTAFAQYRIIDNAQAADVNAAMVGMRVRF